MIGSNVTGASSFDLKPPSYYFVDIKTQLLLKSAMLGDIHGAKRLVADGANPNDEGPLDNSHNRLRPLHYAIAAGNKDAIRILISAGADPELSVAGLGRSFLFAMALKDQEILSLLLDLKPISELSEDTLEYMLFQSVTLGSSGYLQLFLDRGAEIDFRDSSGYTALIRALDAEDYGMAQWLLLRGASVNVEAYNGMTPTYSVEFHLKKYKVGSPTYNKVLRLKELMQEHGAVFPPQTPAEVRAKRGIKEDPSLYQH